jgi:prepilin-type N-terminal cleavage/methylation domain-containing protein
MSIKCDNQYPPKQSRPNAHEIASVDAKSQLHQHMSHNDAHAFTLAEVLITLGIIGIVAAMTIPTLMNNIQDQQYKVAWKKQFSIISQATLQMANDNGGTLDSYFTSDADVRDKYAQYIKKAKVCDDSIAEKCRVNGYNDLSGTPVAFTTGPALITADGAVVQFWLSDATCNEGVGTPVAFYRCGGASVDVNGVKPPNTFGKDTFFFDFLKDRILPYGTQGDNHPPATECVPNGFGQGCSAVYLYQ